MIHGIPGVTFGEKVTVLVTHNLSWILIGMVKCVLHLGIQS